MARLIVNLEGQSARRDHPSNWDLASYPRLLPSDDRPMRVATERMLWRKDGSLAADIGKEYPVENEPLLIGHDEYVGNVIPFPPATPPRVPRRNPRKSR